MLGRIQNITYTPCVYGALNDEVEFTAIIRGPKAKKFFYMAGEKNGEVDLRFLDLAGNPMEDDDEISK